MTCVDRGLFRRATPEEVASWRAFRATTTETPATTQLPGKGSEFEWFTEENTQALLVGWLRRNGWTVVRTANTATRQHGVDVVAERVGERLGVEVKGYPSRFYVAGPKKGQRKTTSPENQAPKWFAHALVPSMKLRQREPESRSVMCFPNFPTYQKLCRETQSSLRACGIEVWLVSADGHVEITE